jgi:HlyD family secretion protein
MTSSSHITALRAPGADMDRPIAKPKRSRRKLALAAGGGGVVLAVAAAAWLIPGAGSIAVRAAEVEIAAVRREPFQDYLPVRAEVAPLQTVFVTAVEGGQVEQLIAQDGAEVAAGAPLARLTNPQLQLDVTAREAEIAARLGDVSAQELALQRARSDRQAQMDETSYNLLKARRELEKRERLRSVGFESDAGVKTYADEADYHRARLAALGQAQRQESAIGKAQQTQISQMAERLNRNLQVVQASLGALVLRAPVAGRLTNFTLQPGQTLKAGDPVGQVDSEGAYKLTAQIDEFYLGRIAPGQTATAEVNGRATPLRVIRVLPQVAGGQFRAELGFAGAAPAGLKRGQSLDLRLTLGDTRPALVLPNGGWMEASNGAYAFVLKPGGHRADRRPITVARRNPEQVEITSGLRAGERVVVSSYAGLQAYKHLILR